ncbi:helix-turn-helix domain-containing protein [Deinococcus sp. UYEF24]
MYPESMPDTIGGRVREARAKANLTMRQLAALALGGEHNARMIASWESEAFAPSIESLRKIAPHLSVSVAELIPDSTFITGSEATTTA